MSAGARSCGAALSLWFVRDCVRAGGPAPSISAQQGPVRTFDFKILRSTSTSYYYPEEAKRRRSRRGWPNVVRALSKFFTHELRGRQVVILYVLVAVSADQCGR
jgi:hypothetical protein